MIERKIKIRDKMGSPFDVIWDLPFGRCGDCIIILQCFFGALTTKTKQLWQIIGKHRNLKNTTDPNLRGSSMPSSLWLVSNLLAVNSFLSWDTPDKTYHLVTQIKLHKVGVFPFLLKKYWWKYCTFSPLERDYLCFWFLRYNTTSTFSRYAKDYVKVSCGMLWSVNLMKVLRSCSFIPLLHVFLTKNAFEDTMRIMSPEMRPESFGTFEKRAPVADSY